MRAKSLALVASLLLGSSTGWAADKVAAPPEEDMDTPAPPPEEAPPADEPPARGGTIDLTGGSRHREGEYGGVTPGKPRASSDGKRKGKPAPPNTITWVGFQTQGGTPTVFVGGGAAVTPTQSVDGKVLTVRFPGLKLGRSRNLTRFIDTRFFGTDVTRIETRKDKRDVVVRITFKDAARQAKVDTAPGDVGAEQLVLLSL
jgi:hypothetical protein